MATTLTEQSLRSTYKDDYKDSDNYHHILFNAGRALQARELTQLQTLLQKEINRFGTYVLQKDGVEVSAGGSSVASVDFIKISNDANNSFSDIASLKGTILTGATSSIKVKVTDAIAGVDGDPDTLYVEYKDNPNTISPGDTSVTTQPKVTLGEILSNGSNINLTVQTINTSVNPALGQGSLLETAKTDFFVAGHFVFVPAQQLFLSKYTPNITCDYGFKVVQDIVTVSDTDALYDNQSATPNRSSPGADRLRIRLIATMRHKIVQGDTYLHIGRVVNGVRYIQSEAVQHESFPYVDKRVNDLAGDFIKKYWKIRVSPNGKSIYKADGTADPYFKMDVDPGRAYINGKMVETLSTQTLPLKRATTTVTREEDQISITYGNYFYFASGVGMLDVDTCEEVQLRTGTTGAGSVVGTANVRAITEGKPSGVRTVQNGNVSVVYNTDIPYRVHLFNIRITDITKGIGDVKSIKSATNTHYVTVGQGKAAGQSAFIGHLHEQKKNALIFDTPLARPKGFTDVTMTFMKKYNFTASGTTHDITLTDSGESFVNVNDVMIANAAAFAPSGITASLVSNNKVLRISSVVSGQSYEVIGFIKKTNATVKNKNLVETTVTTTLDSDGSGWKGIPLGQSDIYEVSRVRIGDSNGTDIFPHFALDAGARMESYRDGRLMYQGGGLDSAGQSVFVRFKHFSTDPSGAFSAVNSYDGEVNYLKVPAQSMPNGNKVSLRDVIDFRPATNGSGTYTDVPLLPVPTDTITADAEYYLPRLDKLIITENGKLQIIQGSPSLNPRYPAVPTNAMDLYNIKLEPNTMHTQDMTTKIIHRKGYTMADIGKLEKKVDRLQEMTSLSLLELNTKFMNVLDSSGNDRAKSGFFVDTFVDHSHTQNKGEGAKSAIDKGTLRPRAPEESVDLYYDSANALSVGIVNNGEDQLILAHTTQVFNAQELASGTINLAPFHQSKSLLDMKISPETDNWCDRERVGEEVIGETTELDLREALNWNNSANTWFGVDPNTLNVGMSSSFISGTSTSVSSESFDPIIIGEETTTTLGEWVEVGNTTDVETLYTETVVISTEREEEISRTSIDSYWNWTDGTWGDWTGWYGGYDWNTGYLTGDFGLGGSSYGGTNTFYDGFWNWGVWDWGDIITTDMWDVITTQTRTGINTVNTTTYERTSSIETLTTYQALTDTTITTDTTTTVNRVASESFIRDVVGEKQVDVVVIPFMRPVEIFFQADGCRANTQYFPFFNGSNVSSYCREETSFKTKSQRDETNASGTGDNEGLHKPTQEHSRGKSNLVANAAGTIIGSFELPNNNAMSFPTGTRDFSLLDINKHDKTESMSHGTIQFHATGVLEQYKDLIQITRVLKIVGGETTESTSTTTTEETVWTESVVTAGDVATDVVITETQSVIMGDTTTTREYVGQTIEYEYADVIYPIEDHSIFTDIPPGGSAESNPTGAGGNPATTSETRPQLRTGRGERGEGERYHDPIAQTFQVLESSGVFVKDIEVFFATKGLTGVACEIRPTVNGSPSATQSIGKVVMAAGQINTVPAGSTNKQMLQNGTTFSFPAMFLSPGEYAICLKPLDNDTGFNVYVGEVGEFQLGTTEARISQQPTLGAFFQSQNGKLWEPVSGTDLAYRLSVAIFNNSGTAICHNVNVPPAPLNKDPLLSGQIAGDMDQIRVMFSNHGLRTGDITNIRGIDSATNFGNGLTGADVNGVRVVTGADNSGYTYNASTNATSRKWFGGNQVTSSQNVNYEYLRPLVGITQPTTTNVTVSLKGATQQSLAGSETRFTKDLTFIPVQDNVDISYNNARAIYNRRTELQTGANKLNGARSLDMQINLTTTNQYVSPQIDLELLAVKTMHNLITRQDSAATDGYNVPLTYISELSPNRGTESAKHITKVTTLSEPAVGLQILVAANRPPQCDFQVYYKVAGAGEVGSIDKMGWFEVVTETPHEADNNPSVFREYRYLVGGENGTVKPFTQFQTKIVMRSTNSAKVPKFQDLRVIALAI